MEEFSDNIVITSARYLSFNGEHTGIFANINGEEWTIPLDEANRHYIAMMKWVAEGNTIED